jgi:hypothetical protein
VKVSVDQTRNHGFSGKVDDPGCIPLPALDFRGGSDVQDSIALNRHRLGPGLPLVDGDDVSVDQNQIRGLGPEGRSRAQNQKGGGFN